MRPGTSSSRRPARVRSGGGPCCHEPSLPFIASRRTLGTTARTKSGRGSKAQFILHSVERLAHEWPEGRKDRNPRGNRSHLPPAHPDGGRGRKRTSPPCEPL